MKNASRLMIRARGFVPQTSVMIKTCIVFPGAKMRRVCDLLQSKANSTAPIKLRIILMLEIS